MTVEAQSAGLTYETESQKRKDPSDLLAFVTEDNEMRNVSLKSVIASKYTLLNETVLELFGAVDVKLNKTNDLLGNSRDTSFYNEWLQRLKSEVESLKLATTSLDSLTDKELDAKIAESLQFGLSTSKTPLKNNSYYKVVQSKQNTALAKEESQPESLMSLDTPVPLVSLEPLTILEPLVILGTLLIPETQVPLEVLVALETLAHEPEQLPIILAPQEPQEPQADIEMAT